METNARARLPWTIAVLTGAAAPALALLALARAEPGPPLSAAVAPLLAVALMASGMIGAAAGGRARNGMALALACGLGLSLLAMALGLVVFPQTALLALPIIAASLSFAARGTLFARSGGRRGWWIALAVLAGEGAMLALALARPGDVPGVLLALLPAQWASMAIGAAIDGTAHPAALLALTGTAATTLLVAHLWPARWPYLLMFSAWLGFAALVWQSGIAVH